MKKIDRLLNLHSGQALFKDISKWITSQEDFDSLANNLFYVIDHMNFKWSSIRGYVPELFYEIECPFKIYTDFKSKSKRLYDIPNSIE